MSKLLIVMMIFSVVNTFAGQETGNGGDVVVCEKNDGTVSIELLDIYEAREKHLLNVDFKPVDTSLEDQAMYQLNKLVGWESFEYFEANINSFMNRVKFVKEDLVDIPDSFHTYIPSFCKVEQIAINDQDGTIFINQRLWDQLDKGNKSALLMHELIYEVMLVSGHTNSIDTRLLNGYIHGNSDYLFKAGNIEIFRRLDRFFTLMGKEQMKAELLKNIFLFHPVKSIRFIALDEILWRRDMQERSLAISLVLDILYTYDRDSEEFQFIIDKLTNMSSLGQWFKPRLNEFKNYLNLQLSQIDPEDSFENITRKSLSFLSEVIDKDLIEDEVYVDKVINLIIKVKNVSFLSNKIKVAIIDSGYRVLLKLNSTENLRAYFKAILKKDYAKEEIDFFHIIEFMSKYGGFFYKNIIPADFLKHLDENNSGYLKLNFKILTIYSSSKFNTSPEFMSILKNALNKNSKYISCQQALEIIVSSLGARAKYREFSTEIQTLFIEDIENENFQLMDKFGEIYKYIKIPKILKEKLIKKIKTRAYSNYSLSLLEILEVLVLEINVDDSIKNLLGFLLEYNYYSIFEEEVLELISIFKTNTKYLETVFIVKLKTNFGNDAKLKDYLLPLTNRKVSVELLDIIKQIRKVSRNYRVTELSDIIISNNTL